MSPSATHGLRTWHVRMTGMAARSVAETGMAIKRKVTGRNIRNGLMGDEPVRLIFSAIIPVKVPAVNNDN